MLEHWGDTPFGSASQLDPVPTLDLSDPRTED